MHFALNYGWGQGIDTAPLGGATLAIQGDAARSDPVDLGRDKGPNQLDITHTFNASVVAISTVKRFDPWLNKILSDNQISLILLVNSGQLDGITGSRDLNFDGNNNDRPLFTTRNNMHSPVRKNVDMRYSRFFQLGGGKRFEVQAEAKNIFNFEEVTAVSNTITVDVDGYPVDPVTSCACRCRRFRRTRRTTPPTGGANSAVPSSVLFFLRSSRGAGRSTAGSIACSIPGFRVPGSPFVHDIKTVGALPVRGRDHGRADATREQRASTAPAGSPSISGTSRRADHARCAFPKDALESPIVSAS